MRKVILFILIVFITVSCNTDYKNKDSDNKIITVSVLPQKYFVERIVGDHFDINVMIPPGASPVTYEPTPKQMKELSVSDVYIRIGHIEFEKSWMKKLQSINPEMKIIDQSSVANLISEEHKHESHDHGHHHHGVDPHIWTSPKEVETQVGFIYNYFIKTYPEFKDEFTNNYEELLNEVTNLSMSLDSMLKPFEGRKFLIFHPALSYFARDYGLEQISIEIDGKEPTPANIQKIIEIAKEEKIKVVFVQKQFSTHNAQVIANEINGRVSQIDPLAYNWFENIKMIAEEIEKSYSKQDE